MSITSPIKHREIIENALYSPCEVAYLLNICMDTTYKLLRSGKLEILDICQSKDKKRPTIRVSGKELLDWIHKKANK